MRSGLVAVLTLLCLPDAARAATDCQFDVDGATMRLVADCTTDASIMVPDGMTLDGAQHTITAVDPPGGHFVGAVLVNGGALASIVDTRITSRALANVCDTGDSRLRGILLNGASGIIRGNAVTDINQGPSACQEGNAIEVWNFSGTPVTVQIDGNRIEAYQKSGIVVSGDVDAAIVRNQVGASAAQAFVPANAIQVGFGAWAAIEQNTVAGNRWSRADAAATAILLSGSAPATTVRRNTITGNADVGIYVAASEATITDNMVVDAGVDGFYDIGIVSFGEGNVVHGNDVRGYEQKHFGVQDDGVPGLEAGE
jgi:parallel beta-helix repeat protein